MATESKSPLKETVMGMGAVNGAGGANGRAARKRPSSLLAVASTLPTVENSLEEFIAKANQTLVDVGNWGTDQVKQAADAEDAKRKELDALRWKAAETQLKEGEARESSLRRQLDGLQGKLAEAEARAAVAADSSGADISLNDTVISELRAQIATAQEQAAAAEKRARTATEELSRVSRPSMEMPAVQSDRIAQVDDGSAERARVAEAKAAKALAAARAIQAGLNVSSADLAAIESGLVVPELAQPKKFPWLIVAGAFVVGIALTFGIIKMTSKKDEPAPVAAAPAAAAPAPAAVAAPTPTPVAAPVKPTVTPIEEAPAPAPAPVEAAKATATPIEAAPAPVEAAKPVEKAPAPVEKAPAPVHHAAAPVQHAAPQKAPAKAPAAKANSKIDDPFADAPAAKKAPAAPAKKPAAGSIADPF